MYALTRSVVAGSATPFAAVRRVESYLRSSYDYRQDVPNHAYPLPAFLSEDRAGYCQHFSGAMALMLRMLGIPSRVAAGFSPGDRDPDRGTFLVEDTDAHAWVEVFFPGIGWVTFDPTPSAAPAVTQFDGNSTVVIHRDPSSSQPAEPGPPQSNAEEAPAESPSATGQAVPEEKGTAGPPIAALSIGVGAAVVLAGLTTYGLRALRRKRLHPDELAEAELAEVNRSLARLGAPLLPGPPCFAPSTTWSVQSDLPLRPTSHG